MKDSTEELRTRPLENDIVATKEALKELETDQAFQVEDFARLRAWTEETERKLKSRSDEDDLDVTENVMSDSPSFGYGTRMIGRTVLEAALYCNRLTGDGSDSSAKELVNLILGKAELIKAEMLKIILSEKSPQEKKREIDTQFEQAKDYFESVMRQIK